MNQEQKVLLVFGPPHSGTKSLDHQFDNIEVALEDFASYFKGFKIKTIELSVSGAVESGGFLRLFVSGKAEAAATVVLEPI
jgi:hypothetical protein